MSTSKYHSWKSLILFISIREYCQVCSGTERDHTQQLCTYIWSHCKKWRRQEFLGKYSSTYVSCNSDFPLSCQVRVSYLEIYNEDVRDLLGENMNEMWNEIMRMNAKRTDFEYKMLVRIHNLFISGSYNVTFTHF